jgi:hypothetical protein
MTPEDKLTNLRIKRKHQSKIDEAVRLEFAWGAF